MNLYEEAINSSKTLQSGSDLYLPSAERSIVHSLPYALSFLDGPTSGVNESNTQNPLSQYISVPKSKYKRLLILFIDSLGLNDIYKHNGLLKEILEGFGTWGTSVFPTITNVVTYSFYTGSSPEQHLMPGYRIYFNEFRKTLDLLGLNVINSSNTLYDAGLDLNAFFGRKALLTQEQVIPSDLPIYNLSPFHILNKGLSKLLYTDNMFQYPYSMLIEGFTRAKVILENTERSIVNLYYPNYDTIYHKLGLNSTQTGILYSYIEQSLMWFLSELSEETARETLFLMISDHGQSCYKTGGDIQVSSQRREEYLKLCYADEIGFSGRVRHFYTEYPDRIADMLKEDFGDSFLLFSREELIESGLAHYNAPEAYWQRIGDLVAVLKPGYGMYFAVEREGSKDPLYDKMKFYSAMHGSLSAEELFIPIILADLQALKKLL